MSEICGEAFADYLRATKNGTRPARLLSKDQLKRLADTLAATNATADLLGRSRIRERQQRAIQSQGLHKHASDRPFTSFAGNGFEPLPPKEAIDYFKSLVPSLGVSEPRFVGAIERNAFTLAKATDSVLLGKVKSVIQKVLETGQGAGEAPADIADLLDAAGVSVTNPQYAEMVFRTNMMDSYNAGAQRELDNPDVGDTFPVWQYLAHPFAYPDHAPHRDLYYPLEATFSEVRGDRVYNCRCSFRPVDKWEWADLQTNGAHVEEFW